MNYKIKFVYNKTLSLVAIGKFYPEESGVRIVDHIDMLAIPNSKFWATRTANTISRMIRIFVV